MIRIYLLIFFSIFSGIIGAIFIYKYGIKLGFADIPNERSSHSDIVPKGGGIGILTAFAVYAFYARMDFFFWIPAIVLSIVSFAGDRHQISPGLRLYIQFICSFIFLIGLFFYGKTSPFLYILIFPLSVFMVGTSNFYNFMDGINGISGLTAIIGFAFAAYYGVLEGGEEKYILVCCVIIFSSLGFLPFNFPRAWVFMGDVGSIFLGFVFSCMVIIFTHSITGFIVLCSFLLPFYIDELSTLFIRIKDKDTLSMPHRKHLYQLLVNELKISHWKISLTFALMQIIVGISVLLWRNNIYFVIALIICYLVLFCICSYIIRKKISSLLVRG